MLKKIGIVFFNYIPLPLIYLISEVVLLYRGWNSVVAGLMAVAVGFVVGIPISLIGLYQLRPRISISHGDPPMSLIQTCTCGLPEGVVGLPHQSDCASLSNLSSSPGLKLLIEKIKEAQGKPGDMLRKERVLSDHITRLGTLDRVMARGEVRVPSLGYFPAVIVYNSGTGTTTVLAPSGEDDTVEPQRMHFFYSRIPYESIAREVLFSSESANTV